MIRKLALFTVAVILLAMKVEASEIPVNQVKDTIVKHSVEMGVDPALALSLAKAESGYSHTTKSPYGAVGVFQLMPDTAKKMGVNPYYLSENIKGGLMYYKMLYKMFGSMELALAAYHTGPAYVLQHKRPAPCSRKYVSAIMQDYYRLKAHTDPAVLRHNAMQEQAKKQAAAKAAAEKAKAEKAKAEKEAAEKAAAEKTQQEAATHQAADVQDTVQVSNNSPIVKQLCLLCRY